jgi:succinate dehydrogenase/fumarate reductase flavoprotein subunit
LVEQFITENTDNLPLRGSPWSTGDGLLAALNLGAKTTSGFGKFDGHNMAAPPATFTTEQFSDASQYFGPWDVAVDEHGNRFTDESLHSLETPLLQDVAKGAGGRAYFIADQSLYESKIVFSRHVGSIIERAAEFGGDIITGDSLAAFGKALDRAGVDGEQTVDTLVTYNRAVREEKREQLNPPRTNDQEPLDTPPFYAVPVQPGIHFTFGGLDIDEYGRILARFTSSSSLSKHAGEKETIKAPIDGLYAVGVDIGDPNRRYYIGGLAQSLASGRAAGKHTAVSLQHPSKNRTGFSATIVNTIKQGEVIC